MLRKNRYLQLVMSVLVNLHTPARVRLNSFKEWLIISYLICIILCLPFSVFLGLLYFFTPRDDPFYMFMMIPWIIIGPFIPLVVYWVHYRMPRKNDEFINGLFKSITSNLSISENGSGYTFKKNDFLFILDFDINFGNRGQYKRDKKINIIELTMLFEFPNDTISEYKSIIDDMNAFLRDKAIGRFIYTDFHSLCIRMEQKSLSEVTVSKVVDEFIYLTKRFSLKPIII